MIINSTPDNLATLGGVASVSEFKIRNSAKAFGILSSGLYANKIRAIIRELGCNAVDSHVAAGKIDVPFDVHLPTTLRPHFSIRDYGIGLDHSDVVNIYTTYFESTKTKSNDFIGTLGLGSKSTFSYTDNFSVTAIKDGRKGVYSAFINNDGVPAVALMNESDTDEPAGVEVQFAVDNSNDFYKFVSEAQSVFTYFAVQPNFTGAEVSVSKFEYTHTDIIPGVHQRKVDYQNSANRAIMGNISYPIEVPNAESNLGYLSSIDHNGLDIHFAIGDIEFQASREGLSYTKATIENIRKKYQEISEALSVVLTQELSVIDNNWKLSEEIAQRVRNRLWAAPVANYFQKNPSIPFLRKGWRGGIDRTHLEFVLGDVAKEYNIQLRGFKTDTYYEVAKEMRTRYDSNYEMEPSSTKLFFVKNPENKKIWQRAKYHFKNIHANNTVLVLFAADETKPVLIDQFLKDIHNPPESQILEVDQLDKPEPKSRAPVEYCKVNMLKMVYGVYTNKVTWSAEAKTPGEMDTTKTYYYVPLKGYQGFNKAGDPIDAREHYKNAVESGLFGKMDAYGIRQGDLEAVKNLSNWVLLEDCFQHRISKITVCDFYGPAIKSIDKNSMHVYNDKYALELDDTSPYKKLVTSILTDIDASSGINALVRICKDHATTFDPEKMYKDAVAEVKAVSARYPLLKALRSGYYDEAAIVEYIKLVDQQNKEVI